MDVLMDVVIIHVFLTVGMFLVSFQVRTGGNRALKVLKSLEFDWSKFKALKSLNFTK